MIHLLEAKSTEYLLLGRKYFARTYFGLFGAPECGVIPDEPGHVVSILVWWVLLLKLEVRELQSIW